MGSDPKTSVCDQWGRAHDHENLFLAGTGVLPTSATCNSTENALAVALRAVVHMLGQQGPSTGNAAGGAKT
jgi:choline dehydrogenase-like flavoprotein